MALAEGQIQIVSDYRDLVMGEGTRFDLQNEVNPFIKQVRADQTGPRAWAHGSYSGAEWQSEAVVPVRVIANGSSKDVPSTRAAVMDMSAAFSAVGDTGEVAQFRFRLDGDPEEYVMFGTPRGFEPDLSTMAEGWVYASASFVAQDPRIYSSAVQETAIGLPVQTGGLTAPLTAPFTVSGVLTGGRAILTNTGSTATSATFRIDGPAVEPRIVLTGPNGIAQAIDFNLTLAEGQWLEIDSTTRLALLNGLDGSNQRGRAHWTMDTYPLAPGPTTLRFFAADSSTGALLTVQWRHASM